MAWYGMVWHGMARYGTSKAGPNVVLLLPNSSQICSLRPFHPNLKGL